MEMGFEKDIDKAFVEFAFCFQSIQVLILYGYCPISGDKQK